MDLGDRMKEYEAVSEGTLMRRVPMIIRLDGKAFHSLTKKYFKDKIPGIEYSGKPFDANFQECMVKTMLEVLDEVHGAVFGYTQSDEITIVAIDNQTFSTMPYFGKRVQKIVSITASMASVAFTTLARRWDSTIVAHFDSRCFVVPDNSEVVNVCIFRQQDATRNSIQSYCLYKIGEKIGHKTAIKLLHGLDTNQQQEALFQQTGLNWNNLPVAWKRGIFARKVPRLIETPEGKTFRWKFESDYDCPIFTQDRQYIKNCLLIGDELEQHRKFCEAVQEGIKDADEGNVVEDGVAIDFILK